MFCFRFTVCFQAPPIANPCALSAFSPFLSVSRFPRNALTAKELYQRDQQYIVRENAVVVVDEYTGRPVDGRSWSDGLQQAIEAKEKVEIQKEALTDDRPLSLFFWFPPVLLVVCSLAAAASRSPDRVLLLSSFLFLSSCCPRLVLLPAWRSC